MVTFDKFKTLATVTEKNSLKRSTGIDGFERSALFDATDFNPHEDTPIEVLHTFLLGVVKYNFRSCMDKLTDTEKILVQARMDSLD
jgi:hypothetical protein